MLLVHISFYTCFAMPYHITLIVAAIDPSVTKIPLFLFIQHIAIVALNFSQAVSYSKFYSTRILSFCFLSNRSIVMFIH
jgi:hypothetical protein